MNVLNTFLITTAVLFPFGWVIYRLIRYPAKAWGEESPLSIKVVYEVTKREYFTRFDFLFLIFFVPMNVLGLYACLFVLLPAIQVYWQGIIAAGGLAVFTYTLWWCVRLFQLESQYWLITKGKTITLDPTDQSIEITTEDETVRITADYLDKIEKHYPGLSSGKMVAGYAYFIFQLKNGQPVYLNDNRSFLPYVMEAYFKTVPIRRVPHKIPWIIAP
ncbi:hypothetical protein ACFPMF_14945 [Larkinella bovis]|uniref:PH domain-containing protein n=1 Tax=Larkinella bovis TaxID=683041 RepID=A0ABW0ID39_9BACT